MKYKSVKPFTSSTAMQFEDLLTVSRRVKGMATLRIAFGFIWAIDASFKWQPTFINGITSYLTKALDGQPPAVDAWITFWLRVMSINPHLFAYLVAITETCIALGLIFGAFTNLTCGIGILLSLMIWSTAQGFGGPYGPGSTDIGVSIIYVLVFIGLFLNSAGWSVGVDRLLASWLGRWSWLASGSMKAEEQQTASIFPPPIPLGRRRLIEQEVNAVQQRLENDESNNVLIPAEFPTRHTVTTTNSRLNAIKRQRLSPLSTSETGK
jgi:uncharacterized membrane protein YphA (DoxX/SURF4 family)